MRSIRLATAAIALGLASAPAHAALLTLQEATLRVEVEDLPAFELAGQAGQPVLVSDATGAFTLPAGLFQGTFSLPTSVFTGVPLVSSPPPTS